MKEFFVSTLSAITLLALLDILVTKTKNGKVVKMVISLVATFLISVPIIKIFKGENNFNSYVTSDELYLKYLDNLEEETIKSEIKITLNIANFKYKDICVLFEDGADGKILKKLIIILDKGVIIDKNEHINMIENAKLLLEKVIDVNKVEIEIETD